jgi:hypothetical protein
MNKISINEYQISPDHYINGKRVASSTNPPTSARSTAVLGEVSAGGQAEVDAVAAARLPFLPGRRWVPKVACTIWNGWRTSSSITPRCWHAGRHRQWFAASLLRVMKRGAHNIHYFAEYAVEKLQRAQWTPSTATHNKILINRLGLRH